LSFDENTAANFNKWVNRSVFSHEE